MPTSPLHRVEPGTAVDVAAIDAADTSAAPGDKDETEEASAQLAERMAELQEVLWARREESVLVVLQGMDTSGKGGTIEHVMGAVNPAGLRVTSFKVPTEPELAHDYLWRIHANVPADGEIAVFDRSHYEDVLVVRVENLVPEDRWRRRYDHINAFEQLLVDEGTTIVKLFLHISKDEQKERLQDRLDEPDKHWKFRVEDLETRSRWGAYQDAFSEAITRTSTEHAPWHIIPADKKWYRNWAAATILVDVLKGLDLTYPKPEQDLSDVVIP
ncbi:MAG TPA: PPK2 family polyphosphate kinase [Acidimicrobiales bacterium]|nr:PPK2 family polyphosphate kinase [Acidimicrobiales bacterium]